MLQGLVRPVLFECKYTRADIATLLELARGTIASPLRAATYETLIGLLAASGLRIGGAINLPAAIPVG